MAFKIMIHPINCPFCSGEREWAGNENALCNSCGKVLTCGPVDIPVMKIGGFYSRDTIIKEIGEDCSVFSDAQLAIYATKMLDIKVIYAEGFVGLVYFLREKNQRRAKKGSISNDMIDMP